ncbi:hypothetical protein D2Q93_13235 [Alicyclobacillaceae bacterium I2511]|nr:hypothetical protein D2Q93_13235 [Alicyclobacillaceae bacterium I2511]
MTMVMKTVKIGIHKELNAVKRQAILTTQTLYNQTIVFYMEFFVGHLAMLDAKKEVHRKKRPPQLGQPNEPITFYADMVAYPDADLAIQR